MASSSILKPSPTRFRCAGCHRSLLISPFRSSSFGGIALIFGFATRYVVLGFVVFMLVATFSSHRYWEFADAAARRTQDSSFYKNTAMLGGFLFLFVCGAGRLSVDGWLRGRN